MKVQTTSILVMLFSLSAMAQVVTDQDKVEIQALVTGYAKVAMVRSERQCINGPVTTQSTRPVNGPTVVLNVTPD